MALADTGARHPLDRPGVGVDVDDPRDDAAMMMNEMMRGTLILTADRMLPRLRDRRADAPSATSRADAVRQSDNGSGLKSRPRFCRDPVGSGTAPPPPGDGEED